MVADIGLASASSSGGLTELARCTDQNSERDCHRLITKKYALSLPVEKSVLETKDESRNIPVLKLTSWAQFLVRNNCWHVLCGLVKPDPRRERAILAHFWSKFRQACPQHDVFKLADAGEVVLERTCPIVYHGDEGRGRKHRAFLVCSFRSMLGRGLQPSEKHKRAQGVKKPYLKICCNYKGHSYTTRYMMAGLKKSEYTGENSDVFSSMMSCFASEAHKMATTGVDSWDGKRWMMLLHMTGDWPWLHKSGSFTRSFNNVQKRKNQQAFVGICHQCQAGQVGIWFEQVATRRPLWLNTEFQEDPFSGVSPFQAVPHVPGQLPALWTFDFFHTWHLGVARAFLGGALALLSMMEDGSNIEDRFSALSDRYKNFCLRYRHRAHITKLTKETINWPKTSDFPSGSWHKGELSTVLMKFLEATFEERTFPAEPMLELVRQGTTAINSSIRAMYKADLWLSGDEGREIAGNGLRFLRRYSELADQGQRRGMNLFAYIPKIHCLQKIYLRVHFAAITNIPALNPLGVSVQQCEDFIGRPSRLSRRVTGGEKASQRVVERYLQACYPRWIEAGYLVRPE